MSRHWSRKKRAGFWLFTAVIVIPVTILFTYAMEWTGWFGPDVILITIGIGMSIWACDWVFTTKK